MSRKKEMIESFLEMFEVIKFAPGEPDELAKQFVFWVDGVATGLKNAGMNDEYKEWKQAAARICFFPEEYSFEVQAETMKAILIGILGKVEWEIAFNEFFPLEVVKRNRVYVDHKLSQLYPDAFSKFVSANRRMQEDNPEAWAQALVSCRRLLKSLADDLYPPTSDPVRGADGKERTLGEEQYIRRLWQFIYEQARRSTSGELLMAQTNDLGKRLDRLHKLTHKGVHAEVSEFEVNQCVIQTYLLVGDLLWLSEGSSDPGIVSTD